MKIRRSLVVFSLLAVLVTIISFWLLQPPSFNTNNDFSLSLLGYTNSSGTNMAILQVTNRTQTRFFCFIGPRMTEAHHNGHPLLHDLRQAANPGVLNAYGVFTFKVFASTDTNLWRVSVQLQKIDAPQPKWRRTIVKFLKSIRVYPFINQTDGLTSPAIGRPE